MKKCFYITERLEFLHRLEVDVQDDNEDDYENFTDAIAVEIEAGDFESKEDIISAFVEEFGEENISFTEDGSPSVEFEAY